MKRLSCLMLLVPLLGACDDTWKATEGRAKRGVQQVEQKALDVSHDTQRTARQKKRAMEEQAQTVGANPKEVAQESKLEVRQNLQNGAERIADVAHAALLKLDQVDKKIASQISEDEPRNQR